MTYHEPIPQPSPAAALAAPRVVPFNTAEQKADWLISQADGDARQALITTLEARSWKIRQYQ